MKKYCDSITNYLHIEFEKSARAYLRAGLEMFHKVKSETWISSQHAIGNLGIAVELMLKTCIVKCNPMLLFEGLPIELQILFTCPDSLPKDFNWRPFDIELRSFKYKTKGLDDCVSLFYVLLPQYKQELYSFFQLLSRVRNASVHSVVPSFQKYELERLAYLALKLSSFLQSEKILSIFVYSATKDDKQFLTAFKKERIDRVKKKIEEATEKSKHITTGRASLSIEGWEHYVTTCPICESDGILTGYNEERFEGTPDDPEISLDFIADSFLCEDCGLSLEDFEELRLAGMEFYYDRSDELDKWHEEHYPDYGLYEPDFEENR